MSMSTIDSAWKLATRATRWKRPKAHSRIAPALAPSSSRAAAVRSSSGTSLLPRMPLPG